MAAFVDIASASPGEDVLVVPKTSVARVGQLELVDVAEGGELVHRIVQLGRASSDGVSVEVLSGLKEGEEIAERRSDG